MNRSDRHHTMSGEDALFGLKLLCRNRQSVRPGERNLSYLMDEEDEEDEEQLILLLFISDVGRLFAWQTHRQDVKLPPLHTAEFKYTDRDQ